jgi:hypothetical protein
MLDMSVTPLNNNIVLFQAIQPLYISKCAILTLRSHRARRHFRYRFLGEIQYISPGILTRHQANRTESHASCNLPRLLDVIPAWAIETSSSRSGTPLVPCDDDQQVLCARIDAKGGWESSLLSVPRR